MRGHRSRKAKFTLYDKISMTVYLLLTGFITYKAIFDSCNDTTSAWLIGYSVGTPLFLYLANYHSLRNIRVYLIWLGFSIYHLVLYLRLIEIDCLILPRGNAASGLRFTILYLVLWQVLRLVHLKLTNIELVAPSRGGSFDFFDNRRINILDYLAFAIYMGLFIILNVFGVK
ncbi:hypothetical protein [Carboxylicivirga marina]|nr:hypothetical protein [uncultured Carboxylicivirga sp.]